MNSSNEPINASITAKTDETVAVATNAIGYAMFSTSEVEMVYLPDELITLCRRAAERVLDHIDKYRSTHITQINNSFDHYQSILNDTAIYPEAGTGSLVAVNYCALGLGEAGEVQGKVKKIWRDDNGIISDEKKEAILGELGDTLWYVCRMANELGSSLAEIAQANVDKLLDRRERNVLGGSGDNR